MLNNCNCGNEIDYCSACAELNEIVPELECTGITDKMCNSLQKDTGLNPDLSVLHDNCEDLNNLLDCLLGTHQAIIDAVDDCNWKEYVNILIDRLYTIQKAMICSECGQWIKIWEHEDSINKLWEKMAKVEAALDALAAQNWEVNTRYVIEHSTPGMSVSIDRSTGDFVFNWSDWNNTAGTDLIGKGTVTGTVNFGMGQQSGLTAKWQIRSVVIKTCSYTTANNQGANQTFKINLYVKDDSESLVYQRSHNGMSSFSDTINQTINIGQSGVLPAGSNSGWIQFLEFFNDIGSTELDDRANVQIQFANNNKTSVPPYI